MTLAAAGLAFSYPGRPVLRGVSFSLKSGELTVLTGPNGCGKSTLLKLLLGLLRPGTGRARLDGTDVLSIPRRTLARGISFVPQDTSVSFAYTVEDIVRMGRIPYVGRFQAEGRADREAVDKALLLTGTEAMRDRYVHELSGGERQRVFIARALAQRTPVMMLDEPTANLDIAHQLELMELLRRLASEGRSILASVHDLNLAARYADRVLVLAEGGLRADGAPGEVFTPKLLADAFQLEAEVGVVDGGVRIEPVRSLRGA